MPIRSTLRFPQFADTANSFEKVTTVAFGTEISQLSIWNDWVRAEPPPKSIQAAITILDPYLGSSISH
jgi:hypothetical protein